MSKLPVFKAHIVNEVEIVLLNVNDIEKVYGHILDAEDFIITWPGETGLKSQLVMGTNLISKVREGAIALLAYEVKEK